MQPFSQGMYMSRWSVSDNATDGHYVQAVDPEMRLEESRIVRAAVVLLRGDVAVLQTGSRAVLAAADGIHADASARQLSNPVDALAMGYQSQLSVPLWRGGRRIGALTVLDRTERRFNEGDIALLRALAGQIGRAFASLH